MNKLILLLLSVFLLGACASEPQDGPWTANRAEKPSAGTVRMLTINDGEWTHLSEDIALYTSLERLTVQNNNLVRCLLL